MDTPDLSPRNKRALFCLVVMALAGCVYDIFYTDWDYFAAKLRLLDAGQVNDVKVRAPISTLYWTFGTWGVVVYEFIVRGLLIVLTIAGIIGLGIVSFASKDFLAKHTRSKSPDDLKSKPPEHVYSVVGEIVRITGDSLQIMDQIGQIETFTITAETEYGTKAQP